MLKQHEQGHNYGGDLPAERHQPCNILYLEKQVWGGMQVSELKRMRELEDENRKLKHMYAELALDHRILKDVIEKKL
jgi:putative transposase